MFAARKENLSGELMEDAGQCFPAVQVYCQDLCLVLRAVYQMS